MTDPETPVPPEAPITAIARVLAGGELTATQISTLLIEDGYGAHAPSTYGWVFAELVDAHERGEILRIGHTPSRWRVP